MTAFVLGTGLMLLAHSMPAADQSSAAGALTASPRNRSLAMTDKQKVHAVGRTSVKSYRPTPFDEVAGAPTLSDIRVTETFSGDIEGEGVAQVVQAAHAGGAATFVGLERVRGAIGARKGTFLLEVHGTVAGKDMTAEWSVVSGSATGELKGLRGQGGFRAKLGEHGDVWLDYEFQAH